MHSEMRSDCGLVGGLMVEEEEEDERKEDAQGAIRVMEWVQGCQVETWKLHMLGVVVGGLLEIMAMMTMIDDDGVDVDKGKKSWMRRGQEAETVVFEGRVLRVWGERVMRTVGAL